MERFDELMACVGNLLLQWSMLEQALSHAILPADKNKITRESGEKVRGTLEERLDRWHKLHCDKFDATLLAEIADQTNKLRNFRNLVVHGLAGGSAQPGDGSEPHIRCIPGGWGKPSGAEKRITALELKHYINAADACRRAFRDPRSFNYRL